ncbi:MAG: flagellar biosynthetic protein FliO, partial [Verrucomicrobiales bacterium]|nr:flagellar biosynthetic protein FliO [Verrucomicrobiales bacterium]
GAESGFASVGVSFVRILGAFGLVLTLFFGGVWAVRNWARIAPRRGSGADLKVLEVRSIGVRQNLVVVGYRRQRLLLSATAGGVTLLTHLPEAETEEEPVRETAEAAAGKPDFVGAFRQVLARGS